LMILDVMLPERDGWSVLADLRRAGKQTPVVDRHATPGYSHYITFS